MDSSEPSDPPPSDRDFRGYGERPPDPHWPNGAVLALQFVVNVESGGENCVLDGDAASESFLSEVVAAVPRPAARNVNMESMFEYGARAGFWRLLRLFSARSLPVTAFGVAAALARAPEAVAAMRREGWEIATHGMRWVEYGAFSPEDEREHLAQAIACHARVTGAPPAGVYIGRISARTLDICAEVSHLEYSADSYADELPYWRRSAHGPQLMVPYTLDANDMKFVTADGFGCGDEFFAYLKDSFDVLYEEGLQGSPKMMSVGLHPRLSGRPGRAAALGRFLDYVQTRKRVWVARRIDIARHWRSVHPPQAE